MLRQVGLLSAIIVGGVGCALTALAQSAPNTLEDARKTFIQAYDTRDYPLFCSVLDKDVAFRGALDPARWTFTADEVIKRFRAPCTCTEYQLDPKCGTSTHVSIEAHLGPFTIVNTNLVLTPAAPPATDNDQDISKATYAMDVGNFLMAPKANSDGVLTAGHYELFWVRVQDRWKLKHIDMKKSGN